MASPPPLPPRQPIQAPSSSPPQQQANIHLTAPNVGIGYSSNLDASDPRTSSSQSLIAPAVESDTRRSLLVIYIHGFYGNDQSFRSFPAHVHAFLTELLSETHIVHSKIYPRYKTYRAIQVARDNFSAWLEPHQSPTTDVILVGHSMGGLLAAEVVLIPNHDPHLQQPFKHRILGTLSLDSPFLGLHPGIVVSGLSSIFNPAPKNDSESLGSASQSSLSVDPSASDLQLPLSETASTISTTSSLPSRPNDLYDPPFFNDLPFREKPLLSRLRHFASKHKAEGILNAIGNHIVSHLEFGGCMADYPELSARYKRIRALEDVDELKAISDGHPAAAHRRVRFVNYYTLSPGRPKPSPQILGVAAANASLSTLSLDKADGGEELLATGEGPDSHSSPGTRDTKAANDGSGGDELYEVEDGRRESDEKLSAKQSLDEDGMDDNFSESESHKSMQHLDPEPMVEEPESMVEEAGEPAVAVNDAAQAPLPAEPNLELAPIPPEPEEPVLPDLSQYTDKDAQKQAEKEAKRQQKAYQQAVKDRNKAIREREKLLEKRRKKADKEAQRSEKQSLKEAQELEKQSLKEMQALLRQRDEEVEAAARAEQQLAAANTPDPDTPGSSPPKRKLRKFCALPSKRSDGGRDPTWVDVYMADVDEVGAHCGLFVPGPHYDRLVGDVGSRIMAWVHEDMSTRAAMDM
ncbi:hypothetical protein PWT90_09549 [Aphanocladium album]|nr:hypothetical protein PWT90_09549 [Aphanocladium album]